MKLLKQNANFTGQLVYDPELRFTPAGNAVCIFSMHKLGTEEIKTYNIECWNNLGEEVAEEFQRGDVVQVFGSEKIRNWTDMNGNEQTREYIAASAVVRISLKGSLIHQEEKRGYL